MIDFDGACRIAYRHIGPDCEFSSIEEKPYGWVFCGNSKRYLETGDVSDMRIGSAGFIVEREDGRIFDFGSAYPTDVWIANYENGFRFDFYDLTILTVNDLSATVRLLYRLCMAYVLPEEEHGVVWRIPKHFTHRQLNELLKSRPVTFRRQRFNLRVPELAEIDAANCCTYDLKEWVADEDADLIWTGLCETVDWLG